MREMCYVKVTFIGTGAGEGYPGMWCECPNCTRARQLGGRNIRGNSCALIDGDLLIDMNAHFMSAAPRLGISPAGIRTLLVTHPHMDHFAPELLWTRAMAPELRGLSDEEMRAHISPTFTELPVLHIYGNEHVRSALYAAPNVMQQAERTRVAYHPIEDGVAQVAQDVTFIPIRARHTPVRGFSHNYIIERGGKALLYASDTGGYDADMLDIVLSHRYDCVIMEGTFGLGARSDDHMSLEKIREMRRLFDAHGVWKPGASFHLTHICPHWTPPHDEYAEMLKGEGIEVAYDGKVIEL